VTAIYVNINGRKMTTAIYGLKIPETRLPAYTSFPKKEKSDELPENLKELHKYLTTLNFKDAKSWEPPFVEVMIWGYDYAPDESILWPKEWPGLKSPYTLKRGDSFSIFLPGKEIPKLRAFLKTRKQKGAVKIDGKKWAVSIRFTFPSESVWLGAFQEKKQHNKSD
jgi:hypothetical protein